MPKTLTVNNKEFEYPINRDNPGWGEEATAWAEEVSGVLNSVSGAGDILPTSAVIANTVGSATNIIGLFFDPAIIRASICEYSIHRKTDSNESLEFGILYVGFKTSGGGVFELVQTGGGDSGVTLTIDSTGQVKYTSDTLAGLNYTGTIKFRARSLAQ